MKLEHKLGLVVGSVVAPGFAQAVAGRRRAALVWMGLSLALSLLGTLWVLLPVFAMLLRLAAGVAAFIQLRRFETAPSFWQRVSIAVLVVGVAAFALLRLSVEGFKIPSSSMYPTLEIGDHIFVDKLSPLWRAPARGEVIVFRYPCAPDRDYVKRVIAVENDTVEVRCNVVYVNGKPIDSQLVGVEEYRDYDDMDHRWFARPCSRYRETLGGHTYEVFHDAERPARDRMREQLTQGDTRDFPRIDLPLAPSCRQSDFYEAKGAAQPTGKVVITKQNAAACEQQAHFVVPPHSLFVMGDNRNNANDSRVWGALSVDDVVGRAMGIWITDPPGGSARVGRVGSIQ